MDRLQLTTKMTFWVFFSIILTLSLSITIPVDSLRDRCMVVFTTRPEDFLKIDIKFQKFHGQTDNDYYAISLINSETNEQQNFHVVDGTFRRQIQLTQNVLYKLCIKIVINRFGSGEAQQNIEYFCSTVANNIDVYNTNVTVPAQLLKVNDLAQSYKHLSILGNIMDAIKRQGPVMQKEQDQLFAEHESKIKSIEWISIIEFVMICALGCYQYFRLKGFIENKQKA